MKYFTSEWWSSGSENADDALQRYLRYIDTVRDLLPISALEFDATHTLHDSKIKLIVNDFGNSSAQLTFIGWDTEFKVKTLYRLTFAKVFLFEQHFPQDEYIESELGDLGYWEWEAIPNGTELRLLFASSAMFRLRFREFSFGHVALAPQLFDPVDH